MLRSRIPIRFLLLVGRKFNFQLWKVLQVSSQSLPVAGSMDVPCSDVDLEEGEMPLKVTRDQFEVRENEVVHTPTGATFGANPDDSRVKDLNYGLVGAEQVIGKDFDIKEIERVAVQLLAERLHSLE